MIMWCKGEIMEYNKEQLEQKKQLYLKKKEVVKQKPFVMQAYEDEFVVRFTHDTTAIEGNTMTMKETRDLILFDRTPGGKELREVFEQINSKKAFSYVVRELKKGKELNEVIIQNVHKQLVENIFPGGMYRQSDVYIQGARHECPPYQKLPELLKNFYQELESKNQFCTMPESNIDPFELAIWTHAEFVGIHPFRDGNGRTSRLIMNYQLMKHNYLPVNIPFEKRMEYYKALDEYHCDGNISSFRNLVFEQEIKEMDTITEKANEIERQCSLEP